MDILLNRFFIASILTFNLSTSFAGAPKACRIELGSEEAIRVSQGNIPTSFSGGEKEAATIIEGMRQLRTRMHTSKSRVDNSATAPELLSVAKGLQNFLETNSPKSKSSSEFSTYRKFTQEISDKINSGKLSYYWLLTFSYRITFLTQGKGVNNTFERGPLPDGEVGIREKIKQANAWLTQESILPFIKNNSPVKMLFDAFAEKDMLAIPLADDLGVFALNRFVAQGISPLGHTKKVLVVDGGNMSGDFFWDHDALDHFPFLSHSQKFREYAFKYLSAAEKLPLADRLKAEFMFFFAYHEESINIFEKGFTPEEVREHFRDQVENTDPWDLNLYTISKNRKWLGQLIIDAGIDIRNSKALQGWLFEAIDVFTNLHQASLNP